MRIPATFIVLLLVAPGLRAADSDVRVAIDLGLKSLAEDATDWKTDRKCASCHHVPMAIWTLNAAKKRGYTVDDNALAELTSWVLAKDDPAKVNPVQKERPTINLNQTPLVLSHGFAAGDLKSPSVRDGYKAMLKLLLADQDKDGAWRLMYVWEPHGSTPDVMTTMALLALTDPNVPDLGDTAKAAIDKGYKWLATAPISDTPQADALSLLLKKRRGRPESEWELVAQRLVARQNMDGGWGQAKGMKSDAFTTGQSLYALSLAGRKPDDAAVSRARSFLLKNQKEDGFWEMASRPGGPGGKSAKNTEPISIVGTAWALLGLIHSVPSPK